MGVTKHPEHDAKDIFPSGKNDYRISNYSEGDETHKSQDDKQHKGKDIDFESKFPSDEDFDKSNIDPDFDIKPKTSNIQKDKRSIERKTNRTNISVLEQKLCKVCKSSIFKI